MARKKRERAGNQRRRSQHRTGGVACLTVPDGIDFFQPKEGKFKVDIIPYGAKGSEYASDGEAYWEKTYWRHSYIGPGKQQFVCLAKMWGKPCPICEEYDRLSKDPDVSEKITNGLKPKERQIFLIYDHKEPEKGIQLWETSHYTFGQLLEDRMNGADDDEQHIKDFDDEEAGSTLRIQFGMKTAGKGQPFLTAIAIDFKERRDGLVEELLDHEICLDTLPKSSSYADMKAALSQVEFEDDDDDKDEKEAPKEKRRRRSRPKDDDDEAEDKPEKKDIFTAEGIGLEEGMEVNHPDHGKCDVIRISRDGTSLSLEDADGDIHKAIGCDEVELLKEKKRKPKKEEPEEEPEDPPAADDDDDDDDDWD